MSEADGEGWDGSGAGVMLKCGHWLSLPRGLVPAAAAAELLHHRALCDPEPIAGWGDGILAVPAAWLPLPEAHR
jgi:hypothetical protein